MDSLDLKRELENILQHQTYTRIIQPLSILELVNVSICRCSYRSDPKSSHQQHADDAADDDDDDLFDLLDVCVAKPMCHPKGYVYESDILVPYLDSYTSSV